MDNLTTTTTTTTATVTLASTVQSITGMTDTNTCPPCREEFNALAITNAILSILIVIFVLFALCFCIYKICRARKSGKEGRDEHDTEMAERRTVTINVANPIDTDPDRGLINDMRVDVHRR